MNLTGIADLIMVIWVLIILGSLAIGLFEPGVPILVLLATLPMSLIFVAARASAESRDALLELVKILKTEEPAAP